VLEVRGHRSDSEILSRWTNELVQRTHSSTSPVWGLGAAFWHTPGGPKPCGHCVTAHSFRIDARTSLERSVTVRGSPLEKIPPRPREPTPNPASVIDRKLCIRLL
jgi:hypothetical protein